MWNIEYLLLNSEIGFDYTLKPFNSDDALLMQNNLISKKEYAISLSETDKTFYIYFNNKKSINLAKVKKALALFLKNNKKPLQIDLSFFITKNFPEKTWFWLFTESIMLLNAPKICYKTHQKASVLVQYNLITTYKEAELEQVKIVVEAWNRACILQDTPPNILYPASFADAIVADAQNIPNLSIEVLDEKQIESLKMNLLLSVSKGAEYPCRVVVLKYLNDSASSETIGLVGKGITFDSGGYSLKPSSAMKGMKMDMSGAAIVCQTIIAAAKLQLKANIVAVACLAENKIGTTANLVETVYYSMNGKSVEINNTDAEGRLVLADGITYAIREAKATKIIDVATLTGAIMVALGTHYTGAFTNDDHFYEELKTAAQATGELIWQMPVDEVFTQNMKTSVLADLSNVSKTGYGGSSNAAAFLQEFVEEKPFIHFDIAGTAEQNGRGLSPILKTLIQYLKNL